MISVNSAPDEPGYALEPEPPEPQTAGPARAEAVADADVFCRRCGYTLTGLDARGRCPECGTPVEASLLGDLLHYSDPSYVAMLHRGATVILVAIVLYVLIAVGALVAMATLGSMGRQGAGDFIEIMLEFLITGVSMVNLYGWWLLSAPDPALADRDKTASARRVVRVAVVVRALLAAMSAAMAATSAGAVLKPILSAVSPLEIGAWVILFVASMMYLRKLAPRLPNREVGGQARTLIWLGPVLWIFGCGIGALVALALYWNLLSSVRGDLGRIRREVSEGNWRAHGMA